ncbi:DUF4145 domain-containing protein [Acidianus sp. HS-5]|uniref:DUF4145 domain-containing protein n=1 Tax=Acidianus sp. HS-5 TaxID=2886040 RepID=UPI001F44C0FF|nr:DUF4145 domain-containing protein [Acidianus sp. HS-5]BDC18259.1 hypothetical protein HS5_11490 [Acidianus sp. HS-5]
MKIYSNVKIGPFRIYNNIVTGPLIIATQLTSGRGGFYISLAFRNSGKNNVEIWFPIEGYLDIVGDNGHEYICRTLETIEALETTEAYTSNNNVIMTYDYFLAPNSTKYANFICIVEPYIALRLYSYTTDRISSDDVILKLRLTFSALFNAGTPSQKTIKVTPILFFKVNKNLLKTWINGWYTFYLESERLPDTVPPEVIVNYFEAIRSFNAGAYRASVVMARRTLELALLRKGLITEKETIGDFIQKEKRKQSNQRVLSDKVSDLLNAIRVFGNYGAHAWDDALNDITEHDARLVIEILKEVLTELFSK